MPGMDAIDVVLVTWPNHPRRIVYFQRTLRALREHLRASHHQLNFLCSSETERDPDPLVAWQGDYLTEICEMEGIPIHWHDQPASLGGAMNRALRSCTSSVIFLVQDDFELIAPVDLSPGAQLLIDRPNVDMIRYSYYLHPEKGTQFTGELGGFQRVKMDGYWPYGDDPQLRHRRMFQKYGPYREDIGHSAEGDMLRRLVRQNACILAADQSYFRHIGQTSALPVSKERRPRSREGAR